VSIKCWEGDGTPGGWYHAGTRSSRVFAAPPDVETGWCGRVDWRPGMALRTPRSTDRDELAKLARELGYDVSAEDVGRRLATSRGTDDDLVLVSEAAGRLVGFVHAQRRRDLLGGERVEIVALVVTAGGRRAGTGRSLVEAAAEWARGLGLVRLRVRTDIRRRAAAAFYHRLGFDERKRQRVFERGVAVDASRPPAER